MSGDRDCRETLTDGQRRAFEAAMTGTNLFITGGAGSGKSFLLKRLTEAMKREGRQIIVCAPTGTAAAGIGGSTIHRAFSLSAGRTISIKKGKPAIVSKNLKTVESADAVIIDEISMVRMDLFELVVKTVRNAERKTKKRKQIIVIGDFCQLPPVTDSRKGEKRLLVDFYGRDVGNAYAFQSPLWESCGFATIVLDEIVRQSDGEFVEKLNEIRLGDSSAIRWFNDRCFGRKPKEGAVYLTGRNDDADEINARRLAELPGEEFVCRAEITGSVEKSDMTVPAEMRLKIGARVMMTLNNNEGAYCNGTLGTIADKVSDMFLIRFDKGGRKLIGRHEWNVVRYEVDEKGMLAEKRCGSYRQYPFRPAYAVTTHKSQGATFDAVCLDPSCWSPGQLYVALSRVRSVDDLVLTRPVSVRNLRADPEVLRLYSGRIDGEPETIAVQQTLSDLFPNIAPVGEASQEDAAPPSSSEGDFSNDGENPLPKDDGKRNPEPLMNEERDKRRKTSGKAKMGRPTPFRNGTRRVRLPTELADEIAEMVREWAEPSKYPNGSVIRLIPNELDAMLSDAFEKWSNGDCGSTSYMAVPIELEGRIRREVELWKRTGARET